jgi:hypothetical protein
MYADLTPRLSCAGGKTVCINGGSSMVSNFMAAKNTIGYTVKDSYTDISGMFSGFWNNECDAVVYDWPLLKHEVTSRAQKCGTASTDASCRSDASLVGDILTAVSSVLSWDIHIPQTHCNTPYHET